MWRSLRRSSTRHAGADEPPGLAGFGFRRIGRPIFPLDVEMLGIIELKTTEE
ncbi:MAG: hypothetical protein ACE5OO_04565 [Candidatus Bathyarchaeia archaeon]